MHRAGWNDKLKSWRWALGLILDLPPALNNPPLTCYFLRVRIDFPWRPLVVRWLRPEPVPAGFHSSFRPAKLKLNVSRSQQDRQAAPDQSLAWGHSPVGARPTSLHASHTAALSAQLGRATREFILLLPHTRSLTSSCFPECSHPKTTTFALCGHIKGKKVLFTWQMTDQR